MSVNKLIPHLKIMRFLAFVSIEIQERSIERSIEQHEDLSLKN